MTRWQITIDEQNNKHSVSISTHHLFNFVIFHRQISTFSCSCSQSLSSLSLSLPLSLSNSFVGTCFLSCHTDRLFLSLTKNMLKSVFICPDVMLVHLFSRRIHRETVYRSTIISQYTHVSTIDGIDTEIWIYARDLCTVSWQPTIEKKILECIVIGFTDFTFCAVWNTMETRFQFVVCRSTCSTIFFFIFQCKAMCEHPFPKYGSFGCFCHYWHILTHTDPKEKHSLTPRKRHKFTHN